MLVDKFGQGDMELLISVTDNQRRVRRVPRLVRSAPTSPHSWMRRRTWPR